MSQGSKMELFENGFDTVEALKDWTPSSWRKFPIKQQPEYADQDALQKALEKVKHLPPLVHPTEIDTLKSHMAEAALGRKFIIQGGDCAERFIDCTAEPIENKFKILLQMSLVIIWGARTPVVRIARLAGQFAKPRTSEYETVNGQKVFSYKGDNINSYDLSHREPDPERLVEAYFHSAATLNYLRAMISSGIADLHHPQQWNLGHVTDENVKKEYENIIERISEGFGFLETIHAANSENLKSVELYTSHEGLLLNYEEALTAKVGKTRERHYNLGAHFIWIGDRTRQIDGAHIEYFRGIANPIGVKVGPSIKTDELIDLVTKLNPTKEPGRLALITRYGCTKVRDLLPHHIRAVQSTNIPVVWICDPCHGNTEMTPDGVKTRYLGKMVEELLLTFDIHSQENSFLGGVHLEMTGEDVTECLGGSPNLQVSHLSSNYQTFCDPRLNYTQSLDFAFTVARKLNEIKPKKLPRNNSKLFLAHN